MKKTFLHTLRLNAVCIVVISSLCLLSPKNVLAGYAATEKFQQATVNGTIVDAANGKPLPGATITVKGSNVSTSSGPNGSFSIPVPGSDATLVVSFVGFATQEVKPGNNSTIDIALQSNT